MFFTRKGFMRKICHWSSEGVDLVLKIKMLEVRRRFWYIRLKFNISIAGADCEVIEGVKLKRWQWQNIYEMWTRAVSWDTRDKNQWRRSSSQNHTTSDILSPKLRFSQSDTGTHTHTNFFSKWKQISRAEKFSEKNHSITFNCWIFWIFFWDQVSLFRKWSVKIPIRSD